MLAMGSETGVPIIWRVAPSTCWTDAYVSRHMRLHFASKLSPRLPIAPGPTRLPACLTGLCHNGSTAIQARGVAVSARRGLKSPLPLAAVALSLPRQVHLFMCFCQFALRGQGSLGTNFCLRVRDSGGPRPAYICTMPSPPRSRSVVGTFSRWLTAR